MTDVVQAIFLAFACGIMAGMVVALARQAHHMIVLGYAAPLLGFSLALSWALP